MQSNVSIYPLSTSSYKAVSLIGFTAILTIGVCGCIALTLGLFWAIIQLMLLTIQSSVETLSAIGTTFTLADPLVRFLLLIAFSYCLYRAYNHIGKKVRV